MVQIYFKINNVKKFTFGKVQCKQFELKLNRIDS